VYANVPNATATSAITKASVAAIENSFTVGVGVTIEDVSVIPLLLGTQIASMAAPVDVGVYLRVGDEV